MHTADEIIGTYLGIYIFIQQDLYVVPATGCWTTTPISTTQLQALVQHLEGTWLAKAAPQGWEFYKVAKKFAKYLYIRSDKALLVCRPDHYLPTPGRPLGMPTCQSPDILVTSGVATL